MCVIARRPCARPHGNSSQRVCGRTWFMCPAARESCWRCARLHVNFNRPARAGNVAAALQLQTRWIAAAKQHKCQRSRPISPVFGCHCPSRAEESAGGEILFTCRRTHFLKSAWMTEQEFTCLDAHFFWGSEHVVVVVRVRRGTFCVGVGSWLLGVGIRNRGEPKGFRDADNMGHPVQARSWIEITRQGASTR